jgi:DNA/RNA-binding domain of Phe-tRNA-synthetase-like protein
MSNPLKKFRLKRGVRTSVTETVTVTIQTNAYAPEAELAKWQEALKALGKRKEVSPQEALAREVIRKRIKELKEAI